MKKWDSGIVGWTLLGGLGPEQHLQRWQDSCLYLDLSFSLVSESSQFWKY